MPEYVIRTASTHELPVLHRSRLASVLLPTGSGCEQADGWGDFRIRCDTTEVAFSAEDPGWQVTFEGPMAETDCERLVTTITQQIEQVTGEPCQWLRIT